MESNFLTYRSSRIHYTRFGRGTEWLFCFHGYGEDGSSFAVLEPLLGEDYTLIAIDMPFHGCTDWQEGLLFEPKTLVSLVHAIKPAAAAMTLLGYSMGGRVAMQLLQTIPQEIKKMVLVAPDGLRRNGWQFFSTETWLGSLLFSYTMRHPVWMFGLLDLAGKLGLYDMSIIKFVHYYLDDPAQRSVLFRRWTTMRRFKPVAAKLRHIIKQRNIPAHLLYGCFDRVILAKHGIRLAKGLQSLVAVREITAGHQLLREKYAPLIAQLIIK
ncbi:MAG: hypothetical protein NVSMB63_08890 [Sediminibacterium sp.]